MTKRLDRSLWLSLLVGGALAIGPTALAQDDIPPPPDEDSAKPAKDDKVPDGPSDDKKADDKRPETPVASEEAAEPSQAAATESAAQQTLESDETIYVVEAVPHLIGNHFELSPQFLMSFNDRFTNHYGFLVAAMYHLRQNVGVELSGGYLFGFPSEVTNEIKEKGRLGPEMVDLYDLTWVATANVQWSPIYGKASVLDFALGQYSLYFSVGTGLTGLALKRAYDAPNEYYKLDYPFSFTSTIGGGLRMYFTDWFGARIEVRDYVQANMVDKKITNLDVSYFDVQNYYMLHIGATFLF